MFRSVVSSAAMFAPPAHAQAEVALVWNAPARCPSGATVEQRIRAIAGESAQTTVPLRAEGRITRDGARYRLTLTVQDGDVRRERIIHSSSCVDLAGAAAVALALLLRNPPHDETTSAPADAATTSGDGGQASTKTDGESPSRDGSPPRSRDGSPPPSSQRSRNPRESKVQQTPAPDDDVPGSPQERNRSADGPGWRFVVRAPLLAVDMGPLPMALASLGAGVGVRYGPWHATAVARVFRDENIWSPLIPEVGVRVEHAEAELWGCRAWSSGRFDVAPCLTLGLNRLTAAGTGPGVTPRSPHSTSFTVGAAGAAHFHIFDWMALFAAVGAGLETSRPHFTIEGLGEVGRWRPWRISTGVGSEWIF